MNAAYAQSAYGLRAAAIAYAAAFCAMPLVVHTRRIFYDDPTSGMTNVLFF